MGSRLDARRHRLVPMAASALLLSIGVVAWVISQARQSLVATIERQGGVVTTEMGDPRWLWDLTGGRLATRVTAVRLQAATIDLDLWKRICQLPDLEMLDVSGSNVGDEHLAVALPTANCVGVSLKRTKITDAGLSSLSRASHICHLDIAETHVGDIGLASLSAMTELYTLGAERTMISDASFDSIGRLSGLNLLYLRGNRITGKTLSALRHCNQLISLDLSETQLQDENVPQLQTLPGLRLLQLDATPLTDRCVPALKRLKGLRRLSLRGVRLSERALGDLRTTLPQCEIESDVPRSNGLPRKKVRSANP